MYIVYLDYDKRNGEVGELVDTFMNHNSNRMIYTLMFNDNELRGYYWDDIEPLIKLVK